PVAVPLPLTVGSPTLCNRVPIPNPDTKPLVLGCTGILTLALPAEAAEPLALPMLGAPELLPTESCVPWEADVLAAHCGELAKVGPELARTANVPKVPRPATIEDATRARLIIECM